MLGSAFSQTYSSSPASILALRHACHSTHSLLSPAENVPAASSRKVVELLYKDASEAAIPFDVADGGVVVVKERRLLSSVWPCIVEINSFAFHPTLWSVPSPSAAPNSIFLRRRLQTLGNQTNEGWKIWSAGGYTVDSSGTITLAILKTGKIRENEEFGSIKSTTCSHTTQVPCKLERKRRRGRYPQYKRFQP